MIDRERRADWEDALSEYAEALPRVPWEQHVAYLDERWQAGQHVSIFARNGGGKTLLIRRLLESLWTRSRVLFIASKKTDASIGGMGHKVSAFPNRAQRLRYDARRSDHPDWEKDPEWYVLQVPSYRWSADAKRTDEGYKRARALVGTALDRAYGEGDWVIVADEVRALADPEPPNLNLAPILKTIWQRGRSERDTLIAGTQAPRWAPGEMYDQWVYAYFGRMTDVAKQIRLGEIAGDSELLRRALPTLERFEFLFVDAEGERQIVRAPAG